MKASFPSGNPASGVVQTLNDREGERIRVLVIDDSQTARATMAGLLARAGFQVFELPSAIGATRVLMRNPVAAVVADVSMPGLSGDKLVSVLRRNPRLKHLAVVIVSGTHEASLKEIQLAQEVDATLSKRDIPTQLVPTVQRALMARGVSLGRRGAVST